MLKFRKNFEETYHENGKDFFENREKNLRSHEKFWRIFRKALNEILTEILPKFCRILDNFGEFPSNFKKFRRIFFKF